MIIAFLFIKKIDKTYNYVIMRKVLVRLYYFLSPFSCPRRESMRIAKRTRWILARLHVLGVEGLGIDELDWIRRNVSEFEKLIQDELSESFRENILLLVRRGGAVDHRYRTLVEKIFRQEKEEENTS